ncbi:MAG: enoyl-CoA hydratase/isomerase family protein [Pyrinomonadaceae bacterium]
MDASSSDLGPAILCEPRGHALVFRFNRPEIRNPLSDATLVLLETHFTRAENDPKISTVIFAGSGDIFASGADLREVARLTPETASPFSRRAQSLFNRFASSRLFTIAAINGTCMGGALDLIMACNHRIASPEARFGHPGARLGIITGWGGTQRMPRLIGRARALDLMLTARMIDAGEALSMGLIDELADDVLERALANGELL